MRGNHPVCDWRAELEELGDNHQELRPTTRGLKAPHHPYSWPNALYSPLSMVLSRWERSFSPVSRQPAAL